MFHRYPVRIYNSLISNKDIPMPVPMTSSETGLEWIGSQTIRQCWLHRQLFLKLLKRDFSERYQGSYLGLLWSFLLPLLSLLVFTFFFGIIFKMRWEGQPQGGSLGELALILFIGMALYNFLAECLSRAPGLVLSHSGYVKNVVFPLEMLPVVMVASACLTLMVTFLAVLLLQFLIGHVLFWTTILLPIVFLPLLFFVLGLSGFLCSLGVYIRDIQQLITPLVQLLMFLSPVFYPINALPEFIRPWLQLNPLALVIEQARGIVLFGQLPALMPYLISLFIGILVMLAGTWWFVRTRKGFADVL
jgi:lipopolysaccharide transport system permease protein